MKRRSFLKNTAWVAGSTAIAVPSLSSMTVAQDEKSLFEWRVYQISRAPNAKGLLENYFQDALIPFLKKREVRFAAFNDYGLAEPAKLYVLIAYPNRTAYFKTQSDMLSDPDYLEASKSYHSILPSATVYSRYETFLLEAFDKIPALSIPAEKKGLFELRLYESAHEDAGRRKILMFNQEEIDLFKKVGVTPVFFGKILAGQYMPALLYMVGFKDMAERDAAWGRFGESNEWKVMREKPEYADTVSNIQRIFLTSAAYSEV
jgi:hypothetical protein